MRQYPENSGLPSGDNPPSTAITSVSEVDLVVGEDARMVALQRLAVGAQATPPLTLASALTASLSTVAYASLVATEVMAISRAAVQTFRVSYTPALDGAGLLVYPQTVLGDAPDVWMWCEEYPDVAVPVAGPTNPPTFARESAGFRAWNPFKNRGALVAATQYNAQIMIMPADASFPACHAIRFALRDLSAVTAGTVTIVGTQR